MAPPTLTSLHLGVFLVTCVSTPGAFPLLACSYPGVFLLRRVSTRVYLYPWGLVYNGNFR